MTRGRARILCLASLVPLAGMSAGCDALTAHSFAGTVMSFTVSNATVTPAGKHLELWARTANDDIVRINSFYNLADYKTSFGLMIRQAVTLDDPCMIDVNSGELLTDPKAYKTVEIAGVVQTPEQQARQVTDRIKQLSPPGGAPLLAVLPYDPTPVPSIPAGTSGADRLSTCKAYWASATAYSPNPYQITAPINGQVYGFISFVSLVPPTNYDGFRLDTPINLKGVQEIFFTTENDVVNPESRGPLFMTSTLTSGGREVVHFQLTHADPNDTVAGAASLYVDIDEDSVQF